MFMLLRLRRPQEVQEISKKTQTVGRHVRNDSELIDHRNIDSLLRFRSCNAEETLRNEE